MVSTSHRWFKRVVVHFPDRVQSIRIPMVNKAPLFRVFDEESYITQQLSELFSGHSFTDLSS